MDLPDAAEPSEAIVILRFYFLISNLPPNDLIMFKNEGEEVLNCFKIIYLWY